jgi:hypothetical protein
MGWRLPSYKSDGGHHCPHGSSEEPCWGQTSITDEECTEDYSDCWVYTQCEAHAYCHTWDWKYGASPHEEDRGATPLEDKEL